MPNTIAYTVLSNLQYTKLYTVIYYIKCIPYLPFNFFQLAIKYARPQAEHI